MGPARGQLGHEQAPCACWLVALEACCTLANTSDSRSHDCKICSNHPLQLFGVLCSGLSLRCGNISRSWR